MAANPISYLEIGEYCRLRAVSLSAWAVGLIRRLDAAVMRAWNERALRTQQAEQGQIPVNNTAGVRALLRSFAARKEAEKGGDSERSRRPRPPVPQRGARAAEPRA